MPMFYVVMRQVYALPMQACGVVWGRFDQVFVSVREGMPPSLYTLQQRWPFWRAHKLRRSVVPLQKRMHDSTATGANCDLLPDHHAPSRGSSPSRPRPMPGAGLWAVPGFAHLWSHLTIDPGRASHTWRPVTAVTARRLQTIGRWVVR